MTRILELVLNGRRRVDAVPDNLLLLDYLRYFVLFEDTDAGIIKKIAGYHQFHAVREAVRVTVIGMVGCADWPP